MALTFPQIFGEWVKRQRGDRTQAELAKRVPMTQSNWSEIESGMPGKSLTSRRVADVLKALEVDAVTMAIDIGRVAHALQVGGITVEGATISPRGLKAINEVAKERVAVHRPKKGAPR